MSQDNTTYSTNYRQHALGLDYVVFKNTYINLTAYWYRRENFSLVQQTSENNMVSRARMNLHYRLIVKTRKEKQGHPLSRYRIHDVWSNSHK